MPEGPEIRRAADKLEAAIKGEPLTNVWFAFPQLQPYQTQLIGQRVTHIATRGKALLTQFSGGLTLYSHNQLYGVWRVVDAGLSRNRTAYCASGCRPPARRFCSTARRTLISSRRSRLPTIRSCCASDRTCWT